MPEQVFEYVIGEFRGDFPNVPIAAGVDFDALKAGDDDPMMVTLPIIPKIGATSRNGLLYDDALADSIVTQINAKRPEGIFGHLKDEERATAYPAPAAIWVGAKKEGGQVWAKAFITDPDAKARIKRLKAAGSQIATSIYGKGIYEQTQTQGVRRLTSFDLESLDFAPPGRAALQNGAMPYVTAETTQENPEMDKSQLIAELTVSDIPQTLQEQIIKEAKANTATQTQISELQQAVKDRDAMVSELQSTIAEYRQQQFTAALDARIAELTNWQVKGEDAEKKLKAFRNTFKSHVVNKLGDERTAEKVSEVVDAVWSDLQPLAETVRDALAGPAAVVSSRIRGQQRKLDESPEAVLQARATWGI